MDRDWWQRLDLSTPIVQAGMGSGLARGELAGAVSAAGALGTVGTMPPPVFAAALADARRRAPGRPIAANLIAPFIRRDHVDACVTHGAACVVLHAGWPQRSIDRLHAGGVPVLATVGDGAAARAALAAGVDGLVAQGVEAGGHVVARDRLAEVLPAVLEVADGRPVLAAGGVADADDVRRLLAEGATAAVAGTRFLLTEESGAHPAYKARVATADTTLMTELFGVGWPLQHRVVSNAATDRWCSGDPRGPRWLRAIERHGGAVGRLMPLRASAVMLSRQRPGLPFFGPAAPIAGMPEAWVDRAPLYAGDTVARLDDIVPAAEAVARLAV